MQYHHYILTDESGCVLDGWSDGPHPERDAAGAILLREDGGYQFRLWQDEDENPPLTDRPGAHLYRYENDQIRGSTSEEIAVEQAGIEAGSPGTLPTDAERIAELEAQLAALLGTETAGEGQA